MNNLKTYRQRVGLSQRALAEKVGLKQTAIGNYEVGIREPSVGTALKIYEVLRNKDKSISFTAIWNKQLTK